MSQPHVLSHGIFLTVFGPFPRKIDNPCLSMWSSSCFLVVLVFLTNLKNKNCIFCWLSKVLCLFYLVPYMIPLSAYYE